MKNMFGIADLKLTLGSITTFATIILGKIFAAINWLTLSTLTSIAGLIVALLTSIHLIVQIRKNWRETPPKAKKLKSFYNSKNK